MPHSELQWRLPGPTPTSSYLVVWWYDTLAKDTSNHVSSIDVMSLLPRWLRSYKRVLQKIDEALTGQFSGGNLRFERNCDVDQLGRRITEAVREGRIAVVRVPPSPETVDTAKALPAQKQNAATTILIVDETGRAVSHAELQTENKKTLSSVGHDPVILIIQDIPLGINNADLQILLVERMRKCNRARAIEIAKTLPCLRHAKLQKNTKTDKQDATLALSPSELRILQGEDPGQSHHKPLISWPVWGWRQQSQERCVRRAIR